ncbi:response regulator [Alteromonas facilis]|uniref:response regulator n=1 Tax=Alteromonas facilis TaxID=2048004 RepID=UPI000C281459|nr:response regulator [Alteromonas facilis]
MTALRILIVDDIATTRELLRGLIISELRTHEPEITGDIFQASTIEEALKILSGKDIQIVFLDIDLPDGNGLDIIDEIHVQHPDAGIIIVSGDSTADSVRKAITKGVKGYVVKPFNAARVSEAINNCIE